MKKEQAWILLIALFIGGYVVGRATSKPKADAGAAVAAVAPTTVEPTPSSPEPAPSAPVTSEAPATPPPSAPPAAAAQNNAPADPNQVWRVSIHPDDAKQGPDSALVKVVVMSAFGSQECRDFAPAVAEARKAFGDKIQIRFKHKVVPPPHPDAPLAAEAAAAANAQGKFWPFHDKLMAGGGLDRASLESTAQAVGLDVGRFKKDLDSGKFRGQVLRDGLIANEVAAHSFPNILVNGVRLKTKTWDGLKPLIDEQMTKAEGLVKSGTPRDKLYESIVQSGKFFEQTGGPPARFDFAGSPTLGNPNAKVSIEVFEDFECPFCSKIGPNLKAFQKRFPNDVKIVFKHLPLDIHANAPLASEASMAAMAQGKFWEYHDVLFANQQALQRADLERYAEQVGLDMAKFKKDLDAGVGKDVIARDTREAGGAGISGTPSVFINGMKYQGPRGYPPEGLEAVARVYFGLK